MPAVQHAPVAGESVMPCVVRWAEPDELLLGELPILPAEGEAADLSIRTLTEEEAITLGLRSPWWRWMGRPWRHVMRPGDHWL